MERRREYSTGNYVDSLQEPQVRFLQVPLKTVVKYSSTLSSELRALKKPMKAKWLSIEHFTSIFLEYVTNQFNDQPPVG